MGSPTWVLQQRLAEALSPSPESDILHAITTSSHTEEESAASHDQERNRIQATHPITKPTPKDATSSLGQNSEEGPPPSLHSALVTAGLISPAASEQSVSLLEQVSHRLAQVNDNPTVLPVFRKEPSPNRSPRLSIEEAPPDPRNWRSLGAFLEEQLATPSSSLEPLVMTWCREYPLSPSHLAHQPVPMGPRDRGHAGRFSMPEYLIAVILLHVVKDDTPWPAKPHFPSLTMLMKTCRELRAAIVALTPMIYKEKRSQWGWLSRDWFCGSCNINHQGGAISSSTILTFDIETQNFVVFGVTSTSDTVRNTISEERQIQHRGFFSACYPRVVLKCPGMAYLTFQEPNGVKDAELVVHSSLPFAPGITHNLRACTNADVKR